LFAVTWLLGPHDGLRPRDIGWAILLPALYAFYALGRGAIDGWYAYWFLDPSRQGFAQLGQSIALLLAAVGLIAATLVAIYYWLGRRHNQSVH
jgi:hypothetical protein